MLISRAYAAVSENTNDVIDLASAPSATDAFLSNMLVMVVLVALFYLLLILPQQRRFKEHSQMLNELKKGDRVVTGGGLVGKIEKIIDDQEVLVDLGNGVKVTALRSMIQGKTDLKAKPAANDSKDDSDKQKKSKK